MTEVNHNPVRGGMKLAAVLVGLALAVTPMFAERKKKDDKQQAAVPQWKQIDFSKIVWPNPPAITRVRYLDIFSGEKAPDLKEKKSGWMDRLSGVATGETKANQTRFELAQPYGLAVDSKGRLYVADGKVGAIFIFNPETKDVELIKNGVHAKFKLITGLAIDDADHLYVSDSVAKHVLVFDPNHKLEGSISEGLVSPAGIAIDSENRFLYVTDSELDQVFVYDADAPFKLLRKMGAADTRHAATAPGDFSRPTNAAVDQDGNVYISDTFNDRIEIFDADGNFIRTFGKGGDGPGYFARPKGISIDSDGHVWVADGVQDRVQVFTPEGKLLLHMGGHGLLPGQFSSLNGLTVDKNDRVFTSEQYIGRVQMFRYTNDSAAKAELEKREAGKKPDTKSASKATPKTEAPAKQ